MNSPITFEKDPIDLVALELGLSDEAAAEVYAARCAELAHGKDFEIEGRRYKAVNWVDALDRYEAETGTRPPREAVVEVVA
jgi:hypothetical protein